MEYKIMFATRADEKYYCGTGCGRAAHPDNLPRSATYTVEEIERRFNFPSNQPSIVVHGNKIVIKRVKKKNCFACHKTITKEDRAKKGVCYKCQMKVRVPQCSFCGGINVEKMHPCTTVPKSKQSLSVGGKPVIKILCPDCPPHKYISYGSFKRHQARVHGTKKHFCKHVGCKKYFYSPLNLSQHKKVHNDPTHQCTICYETFTHQSELSTHTKREHTEVVRQRQWVNRNTVPTYVATPESGAVVYNNIDDLMESMMDE